MNMNEKLSILLEKLDQISVADDCEFDGVDFIILWEDGSGANSIEEEASLRDIAGESADVIRECIEFIIRNVDPNKRAS